MEKSSYRDLFLSESAEILDLLNNELVQLEKNPRNTACLNEIFRQAHSLKGMAATMGYEEISRLTHEMETVLDLIRNAKAELNKTMVTLLFRCLDLLRQLVNEENPASRNHEFTQLISKLQYLSKGNRKGTRVEIPKGESVHEETRSREFSKGELRMVRVPVERLDHLMNLVGELVINRTRLENISVSFEDKSLLEAVTQMGRLTDVLQYEAMELRLVPVEYIFKQFPRLVRDLAQEENKEIELIIEGSEIGLDRTILEGIYDPLHHLLRNAVSHGIETPEIRKAFGKKSQGVIRLSAHREENSVLIEVSDDGKGMNVQEIKKKAVHKGIVTEEEASRLSDEAALLLITYPGFTLSDEVTQIRGRGMGMNAVLASVESFGGNLSIMSTPRKGTAFLLKLPLTMAIVQALLVSVSDETYAIPLGNVLETFKIDPNEVQRLENFEMIPYRKAVLPLIRLRERFGFSRNGHSATLSVVIVEAGHKKAAFEVDKFLSQGEVVIKTLKTSLKNLKGISGATILGDGNVALILDVASITR